ncbi:MAG: DUF1326 domain-containing protein [Longimicrobiales bacterium]
MNTEAPDTPSWWARGLLFESCNCTVICPGHVHFSQNCTHERCKGYWAVRFDEGEYGTVDLSGVRAVIAYDTPQHMISGDWTEVLIVDDSASQAQIEALENILTGRAGGPWEVLGRFVGTRLPTRIASIAITDEGTLKRVAVEGLLEATIEDIRGRDRSRPVTFQNMFNQIHAGEQVIATGETHYDDGDIAVETKDSHALHSKFDWRVAAE